MDRLHDNTLKDLGILWGKGVTSEVQPIRELVAFIGVEYDVRIYGCKPMDNLYTNSRMTIQI